MRSRVRRYANAQLQVKPDGLAAIPNGTVVVPQAKVRSGAVVEYWGIVWIESDGRGAIRDSLLILALIAVGNAAVVVRHGHARVEPDRLREVRDGLA